MTGFINYFKDKVSTEDLDEIIAEVLAHEIAHIALGHTKTGRGSEPTTEIEADLFAIKLLVATGFPCTGGYKGMKLMDSGRTEFTTHPPAYFRVVYLKTMCEVEMKKYE
jgi:predicted Zn-dependent protease